MLYNDNHFKAQQNAGPNLEKLMNWNKLIIKAFWKRE